MKNTLFTIGLAGLTTALLSSFAFTQKSDNIQEPQKKRHVRLVKIENGEKMELDTVFTNDDIFVWNGDTINPVTHVDKFKNFGFNDKNGNVMFLRHHRNPGKPMGCKESGDEIDVFVDSQDSAGEKVIVRKKMRDGNDEHFPPVSPAPPVPPVPHAKFFGIQHSGKVIDLNDPNIISFKKKDLGGGKEKIEIIRKKSENNASETFNFKFDDDLMLPEPPEAPEFNWDADRDSLKVKVIEKKKVINGKEGKEFDVKVEKEENK